MKSIKHYINAIQSRSLIYLNERKGWRTNRKIIVIESDDWGSIRMPSLDVYKKMLKDNLGVDNIYNKYDSIASTDDLSMLFNVLIKFKDKNINHPKITANTCVANPDFIKIKQSQYNNYFYEPFTETIKRYPNCNFENWKEGINKNLFVPQLHGREHLNVSKWIKLLQQGNKDILKSFDYECWGARFKNNNGKTDTVVQEFLDNNNYSITEHKKTLRESADLFKKIFGFNSKSFIAPNYTWNTVLNSTLKEIGIDTIQGSYFQQESSKGNLTKVIPHYIGEQNKLGQIYLIRNCLWEPTQNPKLNNDYCLKGIEKAFKLKKPAIISAHRLNFIGAIHPENRDKNLKQFSELLKAILTKWPDVEFMSSGELGEAIIIKKDK